MTTHPNTAANSSPKTAVIIVDHGSRREESNNLLVAVAGGVVLLAYDVALSRGGDLPGGDLRAVAVGAYIALVALAGSLLTYLWVRLPTGSTGVRRRSAWSALLGLFAALPIAYLVLVVAFQVVAPILR